MMDARGPSAGAVTIYCIENSIVNIPGLRIETEFIENQESNVAVRPFFITWVFLRENLTCDVRFFEKCKKKLGSGGGDSTISTFCTFHIIYMIVHVSGVNS